MLEKIEKVIGRIVDGVGYFLALVLLLMTLNVSFDVMMRYVFHNSSVGMQEMEWHLFSVMILFGVGYALKHEAHVRVDFIYDRMSQRTKSIINITGTLLFLMPLALLILTGSYGFVHDSFISHEISDDPGGLPVSLGHQGDDSAFHGLPLVECSGLCPAKHQTDSGRKNDWPNHVRCSPCASACRLSRSLHLRCCGPLFRCHCSLCKLMPNPALVDVAHEFFSMFSLMPFRIFSIMTNTILMAIPLFILMGIILQKSQLAERLLESMGILFGKVRGGLAISTVLVGALLAASTGVVGASVVAMGVICLPVMLKYGYSKQLSTGTICAAGTLGQIIPPSIVLIVLGDVFQLPVGDLFQAAFVPGFILVACYIVYIAVISYLKKDVAPAIIIPKEEKKGSVLRALKAILPPLTLIVIVLGSIFAGIATPTESASVGALGAMVLAAMYRKLTWKVVIESCQETVKVTAMVFAILIGATAFSMVFIYTGADLIVEQFMMGLPGEKWGFIFLVMLAIFLLGFFIDFIEISYIVVPILLPTAHKIGIDPMWFAILIAMNLQSSFLTPPFGFSLFYLKGVAPPEVSTLDIYRGVLPFIFLQMMVLIVNGVHAASVRALNERGCGNRSPG